MDTSRAAIVYEVLSNLFNISLYKNSLTNSTIIKFYNNKLGLTALVSAVYSCYLRY